MIASICKGQSIVFHINLFFFFFFTNAVFDLYFRYLIRSITFIKKFFLCLQNGSNIYSLDFPLSFDLFFTVHKIYTNTEIVQLLILALLFKAEQFSSVRRSNPIHL